MTEKYQHASPANKRHDAGKPAPADGSGRISPPDRPAQEPVRGTVARSALRAVCPEPERHLVNAKQNIDITLPQW